MIVLDEGRFGQRCGAKTPPRRRPNAPMRPTPARPGMVRSSASATLALDVTIPPNTTAKIYVPARDPSVVREAGRLAADTPGLRFLPQDLAAAIYEAAPGRYRFHSQLP